MNELIAQLVSGLGVQEGQAQGGAGLLLKLAQSKLGGDFSKVAQAVPGVQDLMSKAPAVGGLGKMLGGLAGALGGGKGAAIGDIASLASGFTQLKLDPQLIGKFIPIIVSFVQSKGGPQIAQLLMQALKH